MSQRRQKTKIASTADWHLRGDERGHDILSALSRLMDALHKFQPDLILHGGDIYERRTPSNITRKYAAQILKEMSFIAPTVVVAGNHDSSISSSPLSSLQLLQPTNLHIFLQPGYHDFDGFSVVAMPWLFRQRATARGEAAIDSLIAGLSGMCGNNRRFLVGHATVFGCKYGEYRDVILGRDLLWQPNVLKLFEFSCLGHIHKPQVIGTAVYAGSPERVTFGERNEDKGYFTFVDGTIEFHSLSPRKMFWFKGEQSTVVDDIKTAPAGANVKATIKLQKGEAIQEIESDHLFSLETMYERPRDNRRQGIDVLGKTTLQVLELYLEGNERKDELLELAKELL